MPLGCPVPTVVTVHDLGYLCYPEAHRRFDRWYLDWTTRRHAHSAVCLVADSNATRADLVRHYGAYTDRIKVIYPGRDETLQRVEDPAALAAVRARYGTAGSYLLYLGTLQPRKNLIRLMDAYVRAQSAAAPLDAGHQPAQRHPQLVLAGKKGWLCDDLLRHAAALGLEERVVFPGYVAAEHKAALLSGALALVFPSLYEGFGMPVLEALACGVPVLTSNVSSLPEVAGDAALMVDPLSVDDIAAGMVRLMDSYDLRRSLIERGYQQAQRFSWPRAAAQLWEVFDSFSD
jgi:glycosyltransferase involved in cell wall biosynthesis